MRRTSLTQVFLSGAMLATILTSPACLHLGNPVTNLWFYTYSSGPADDRDTSLTAASFLDIRSDGTYTRDFGKYEYGKWKLDGKQLSLRNQQEQTHAFSVEFSGSNEMQIGVGQGVAAHFESQPFPGSKPGEDPFSRENNRWRIPAATKETDAELRSRLRNHCQFWEAYFAWALTKELTTVDVRSTPTLIKIYGNGFGLKPYEDLPAQWRSYFFDEEDCRKANDQMKELFNKHTIAWAHTDSKYKMFIGALQQIEQYLK